MKAWRDTPAEFGVPGLGIDFKNRNDVAMCYRGLQPVNQRMPASSGGLVVCEPRARCELIVPLYGRFWRNRAFEQSLMKTVRNIAAYKFAALTDLKPLRLRLLELCQTRGLKGTILLSTEGINLFVAGGPEGIDELLVELRSIPGLEALEVKVSESAHQPFNRMLVRIKKEIIAFGVPGVDPVGRPSPKLAPKVLKAWLDEGRPLVLLDTRNDYEVKLGTFRNALPIGVDHFREFPDAVARLPEAMKDQPIVMFCTGGIRCEKAGPFMELQGFRNIFQLEGGILKYFEECGGSHYDGECFVFDQRVGVDPALQETESSQCFRCLSPLKKEEMDDARYVPNESCPYCYRPTEERRALLLAERQQAIRSAVDPLPGSTPADNFRPLRIPDRFDGFPLVDFLSSVFGHISKNEWETTCASGAILDEANHSVSGNRVVRAGERYLYRERGQIEPTVNGAIRILHEDEALIVVNKPAPLPMHPSGRFHRNTLQFILNQVYHPQKPHPAHRLDANTTGVVLLTRTRHFASILQPQFERREVSKLYVARVQGRPSWRESTCTMAITTEAGPAGSRSIDESGLPARTEFRVLQEFGDGSTLVEAKPITGRTNQIRIHLWHLGFPILGDKTYLRGGVLGNDQTVSPADPPLCLHAWSVDFVHPLTRQPAHFEAPLPGWADA